MGDLIGVDIGGTNIRAVLFDKNMKVINRLQFPTGATRGYLIIKKNIVDMLNTLSKPSISAIGIGCAGLIDHTKGIIRFSPNFRDWKNIHIKDDIEKAMGIPTYIINDVNAAIWGEVRYKSAIADKNVLCITLGTGIGGGLLLGGKLHIGSHDLAGEIGHTIYQPNGKKCACGRKGCLEAYISSRSIINRVKNKMRKYPHSKLTYHKNITVKDIADKAKQNDHAALEIFYEVGVILGNALANASILLDLDMILIGGNVSKVGKPLFQPLIKNFEKNMWKFNQKTVKITRTALGADSGVIGSALWASHKLNNQ